MVLVLVDQITSRNQYTFDFIFAERGVQFEITTNVNEFKDSNNIKLNYSTHPIDSSISIAPTTLLLEESIRDVSISKGAFESSICLAFDKETDVVASIFYILSRYEEYTSETKDEHGRFPFESSILNKYGWIESAICDRWAVEIVKYIDSSLTINASINRAGEKFKVVPTFDIDNAYAYLLKEGSRKVLSTLKDISKGDKERIKERKEVLSGAIKDPYDTYSRIIDIAKVFSDTKLFWLSESKGKKDRNVPIEHEGIIELLKSLNANMSVNLHPSYGSYGDVVKIKNEKSALESVLGHSITASRQHYLRFTLPETYQEIINAGFSDDYSMGFAEHIGFRSGTARAHYWFDLSKNSQSNLVLHPFVYMDGSLNEYMKLSVEQSSQLIFKLYAEVCEYGGDFIFLWHNETIGDYGIWKGWSKVLDYTLTFKNE